jgi:hypothetical protein
MTNPEVRAPHNQPRVLATAGPSGPCAPARGEVDTRCADAERLAYAAQSHQQALRDARREHAAVTRLRDSDARLRDRRHLAEQKTEAQAGYHGAVFKATEESAVQDAAAVWLRKLDQLNRQARVADERADSVAQRVAELERSLPGLELAADAARISAEAAHVGCLEARRTLAACEETQHRATSGVPAAASNGPAPTNGTAANGTPANGAQAGNASRAWSTAPATAPASAPAWSSSGAAEPASAWAEEAGNAPLTGATRQSVAAAPAQAAAHVESDPAGITRAARALMRGDRQTLLGLALRLAEETGFEAGRLQLLLLELREQIATRALEDFCLAHPDGHPFWSQFTAEAARDVTASLASMGYRFDGRGGWLDNRSPQTRDLALALSYCGYDPRSMRRPAGQPALDALWNGTVLRSEEYLLAVAPDLALTQVVDLLGPRSGRLGELWDTWGRLRPLLMRTA